MSDLIPTNPTPKAVPWSPEMMTPETPAGSPVQNHAPRLPDMQSDMQPQMQAGPNQAAPQYRPSQPEYAGQAEPHMPQGFEPHSHMPPAPFQAPGQASAHASDPYAAAPQPQYAPSPQYAPALQPVHHMQQSAPPQMASAAAVPFQRPSPPDRHMPGQMSAQFSGQPQYAQPGPPPPLPSALPAQMHLAALEQTQAAVQTPKKSKTMIANLLKRSPKPAEVDVGKPITSGSIFNKTFVLGTVTGLIIGAFVLPMAIGAFGGGSPTQAQAQTQAKTQAGTNTEFNAAPAASGGDTFIDNAIATDSP